MSVTFPTGLVSSPKDFKLQEISSAEGERLLQHVKGTLPPGSGYASSYYLLSPQFDLGCGGASAEVIIRLTRAYGVNVYHASESDGYKNWHLVKSKLSIVHAELNTVHGKKKNKNSYLLGEIKCMISTSGLEKGLESNDYV